MIDHHRIQIAGDFLWPTGDAWEDDPEGMQMLDDALHFLLFGARLENVKLDVEFERA